MMTRKDSPFLNYWNNGFHQVVNTGTFKKICQEAVKKHGMCVFDIFYYNKYHIAVISIFILDIFFVATQFNHGHDFRTQGLHPLYRCSRRECRSHK